ncbi:MAG: hypothetical protein AAFP19_07390 [Bacteroidota bacterium]
MKKLNYLIAFLGLIVLGYGCSNDFDLVDEWQDIPVAYGLLSIQDTAHYIRIEKAFLDPETSALVVAQNPDSLYYSNLSVELERVSTEESFPLVRVDGNLEGYVRDDGVFANMPNYLYKLKLPEGESLVGGEAYMIKINRGDSKPLVTAETTVLGEMTFIRPNMPSSEDWIYGEPLDVINRDVRWRFGEESDIFDVSIRVHYDESVPDSPGEFISKTIEWVYEQGVRAEEGSPQFKVTLPAEEFYRFLQQNIDVEPSVNRVLQSYDYVVKSGGAEIIEFVDVGQASTGLTSSQIVTTYTNFSEGFGLFSSRNEVIMEGFTLNARSRDTLRLGIYTKDLNFQ